MSKPLWAESAACLVDRLGRGDLDPDRLLNVFAERIEAVNPVVNALPTLCFDRAHSHAETAFRDGPFHGLPVPIKDSYDVAGVRSTHGSMAYADRVPGRSDYAVEAIEASGGIVYAKSNTPEFEAGANTFNEVFGFTRNPFDLTRSAAGSSGGAAVAVATGMAPVAQGSDFACSLRFPASFCGVVGLRPSAGLVPMGPHVLPYQVLSVTGPIARSVEDVGLALDGMVRFDPRDPLTRPNPARGYRAAALEPCAPENPAFSLDLGFAAVSDTVRSVVEEGAAKLEAEGLVLNRRDPKLVGVREAFLPLRAFQFAALRSHELQHHRDRLKPEVVWNIEAGHGLDARTIADAEAERERIRRVMLRFLSDHDCLITAAAPVPPYPIEDRFVASIDGQDMENYIDWTALGFAITLTGCPALVLPCGFTAEGLPIGLQIIGRPYEEKKLLSIAAWCERRLGSRLEQPVDPVGVMPQA